MNSLIKHVDETAIFLHSDTRGAVFLSEIRGAELGKPEKTPGRDSVDFSELTVPQVLSVSLKHVDENRYLWKTASAWLLLQPGRRGAIVVHSECDTLAAVLHCASRGMLL